jgi:deazaflavin-dependent oxidoreductase (nitroreductase family)
MPFPAAVARFNKHVTNQVTSRFAAHLPGFAVVTHVGRMSGRVYRTPVNMFRRGDARSGDYVFVMTYGQGADWVKNVDAAGQCDVTTRGRVVHLVEPRHYTDPGRQDVPAFVRPILGLIDVDEFLSMRAEPGS